MLRRAWITGLLFVVGLGGCTRNDRPPEPPRRSIWSLQTHRDPSRDGTPPPEHSRSLSGPLAACVHRVREQLPREIAGALEALEYPSATEDACRLALAVTAKDPALCDGVALSTLRETCRARTAMVLARPEACPPAWLDRGRDPVCVALAMRSPGLCAAANHHDQIRCLAIARSAVEECDRLDPLLRPRCRSDVTALRGAMPVMRSPTLPAGTAQLQVTFSFDGGSRTYGYTLDAFARGVFVDDHGMLYLVDPARGWPSTFAVNLTSDQPMVGVAVALPHRPGPARLDALRVVMADGTVIDSVPGTYASDVTITELPRSRGSSVRGSVRVQASATGIPVTVELQFSTFVRDIVTAETLGLPDRGYRDVDATRNPTDR